MPEVGSSTGQREDGKEEEQMFIVSIDEDTCTGCNECAPGCPARILSFNGEKAYVSGDECECMGCEACVMVCPSGAITIMEM